MLPFTVPNSPQFHGRPEDWNLYQFYLTDESYIGFGSVGGLQRQVVGLHSLRIPFGRNSGIQLTVLDCRYAYYQQGLIYLYIRLWPNAHRFLASSVSCRKFVIGKVVEVYLAMADGQYSHIADISMWMECEDNARINEIYTTLIYLFLLCILYFICSMLMLIHIDEAENAH